MFRFAASAGAIAPAVSTETNTSPWADRSGRKRNTIGAKSPNAELKNEECPSSASDVEKVKDWQTPVPKPRLTRLLAFRRQTPWPTSTRARQRGGQGNKGR